MRGRTLLLALALLTMGLAGCIGTIDGEPVPTETETPPGPLDELLSKARFDKLPGKSVWIEASSDDTRLHNRLFLPDTSTDPDWKAPTILVMSPYFGHDARQDETNASSEPRYFRYQWLIDHFVPRGYAVVFSDVRGTGDSGGCLQQTAPEQRQDGHDLVEWIADQPWSNGRVGMFGKSYDAETQQGTAITAPEHLTTIVPVASVSGQYEWNYYDGVPFTLHTLTGNAFYMASDGLQPPTTQEGLVQYWSRPGCHPQMLSQGADRSGDWNQYWADREFRPHVDEIEASVLYVHGLQDWNVRQVAIRDWFEHIPSPKRAILGQWAHDYPNENRWNDEWNRMDWRQTVHAWYDHWLLGIDNQVLERLPPVQVQDSTGTWRAEATYPPADAQPFKLHLSPDGLVFDAVGTFDEPLLFRENEEAFARAQTGQPVPDVPTPGVPTQLAFTSPPLNERLHVSGWPTLTFDVLLFDGLYPDPDTETDAHFAANLFLVENDQETWLNSGYLSARHRDGVDVPNPVPEDEVVTYDLRFHPGDTVLPQGSQLKLVINGSDRWTEPEGTFWGAELHRGVLELPLIERDWEAVRLDVEHGPPITER